MRVALLGGTFNPPHIAHLYVAEFAARTAGYDRIIFVPANRPAHKSISGQATSGDRLKMVQLATASNPRFVWDDCEVRRGGISYTIDTVRHIQRKYRLQHRLGLLLGDDLLEGFESWRECGRLASMTDILVFHRQDPREREFEYEHTYLENTIVPISSTQVRRLIREGKPIRYLVPERVRRYIRRKGLYGLEDEGAGYMNAELTGGEETSLE